MLSSSRIRLALTALALVSLFSSGLAAQEADPELATEDQKMLYTLGLAIAQQIAPLDLTEAELELVKRGVADAALKRSPQVDPQTYGPKLQGFAQARMSAMAEVEKTESAKFLDEKKAEPGAVETVSGLVMIEIAPGTGESPKADDTVKVHYHGTLRDGTVFDSSRDRGEPAQFALNRVIPCWTEGLQKMRVGGKSRLFCPSDKAYGDMGQGDIPGGAALEFEVELLEIVAPPAAEGS